MAWHYIERIPSRGEMEVVVMELLLHVWYSLCFVLNAVNLDITFDHNEAATFMYVYLPKSS